MRFKSFHSLLLAVFYLSVVTSLKVQINDRRLYQVTPTNNQQLQGLRRICSNPEVILWSGMGGIGEPVEYLAVPDAMDKFNKDMLAPLNLAAQVKFHHVEIALSTSPPQWNPRGTVNESRPTTTHIAPPSTNTTGALLRRASNNMPSANSFQKISGTDLYTGVWYTMRMRSLPQGFVTYTAVTDNNGAHFMQLDLNPNNLPHYKRGKQWHNDAQWRFGVTEDPSFYTLDNRVLSATKNAITTYSTERVDSMYIIASTKPEDIGHLSAGGKWRDRALWKPILSTENSYELQLKSYPSRKISATGPKSSVYNTHSHYIQVEGTRTREQRVTQAIVSIFGIQYPDTQFLIELPDLELSAFISEFKFMELPSSVLNSHKKSDSQSAVVKLSLLNPSSATYTHDIEESFSKTNTFSYGFEQSLRVFMKVTASYSVPLFASGSVEAGFEAAVGADQQETRSTTQTYTVRKSVFVPPHSSVEVSAFSEWIQDLEIPFNATMIIRGTSGTKTDISGESIQEYLTSRGENYDVLESTAEHLAVNMRGKFKGTFGYRGIVSVKNVNETIVQTLL